MRGARETEIGKNKNSILNDLLSTCSAFLGLLNLLLFSAMWYMCRNKSGLVLHIIDVTALVCSDVKSDKCH